MSNPRKKPDWLFTVCLVVAGLLVTLLYVGGYFVMQTGRGSVWDAVSGQAIVARVYGRSQISNATEPSRRVSEN